MVSGEWLRIEPEAISGAVADRASYWKALMVSGSWFSVRRPCGIEKGMWQKATASSSLSHS